MLPSPNVHSGFLRESTDYEIRLSGISTAALYDLALIVNDFELDRVIRKGEVVFPFRLDFYAGDLRLSIASADRVLASIDLVVDPDVAKLTRADYAVLQREISEATLALYRVGPVTVAAHAKPDGARSELVTLELIRSQFDGFIAAVDRLAAQPVRQLGTTRSRVGIARARRVDDQSISKPIRRGELRQASYAEQRAAPVIVSALSGMWLTKVDEPSRTEQFSVYENRAILGFMRWLDGFLSGSAQRLQSRANGELTTEVTLARIRVWRRRLAKTMRQSPFTGLSADFALRSTPVFRQNCDYSRAFTSMVSIRSGLAATGSISTSVPVDRTFALYEIWCCVRLLFAAAELFPDSREKVSALLQGVPRADELGIMLSSTRLTVMLDESIELTYQRRFDRAAHRDGTHTKLITAIPDITISKTNANGACTGLVVVDPKYRAGASLLDGVRDLHAYRDAIRLSDGATAVRSAVVLAPHSPAHAALPPTLPIDAPLILQAKPDGTSDFFNRLLTSAIATLA